MRTFPSLLLVLMGSMDCLTTLIGILYFGAVECNPLLAGITRTSLPAFTAIKLTTTILVGFLFHQAGKSLMKTQDKNSKSFVRTSYLLKGAYLVTIIFLLIVVLNNIILVAMAV